MKRVVFWFCLIGLWLTPAIASAASVPGTLTIDAQTPVSLSAGGVTTLKFGLQTPSSYANGAVGLNTDVWGDYGPQCWVWGPIVDGGSFGLGSGMWQSTPDSRVFSCPFSIDFSERPVAATFNSKYDTITASLDKYSPVYSSVVTIPVEVHPFAKLEFPVKDLAKNKSFLVYVHWNGFGTDEVVRFYHAESGSWVLRKTVTAGTNHVPSDDVDGEDSDPRVMFSTSVPAAGSWKAVVHHANDLTDFAYDSAGYRFTVKPYASSLSISLSRSAVRYNTRRVRISGRLLIDGRAGKYKTVKLYRDGAYVKSLKTDRYGKVATMVTASFSDRSWQLRYSGSTSVCGSRSSSRSTHGVALYDFADTGNLLEHPYLYAGRSYQMILVDGYAMHLASPGGGTQYWPYGTFSFTCRKTGYWMLYAENRDIFDGEPVEVIVW